MRSFETIISEMVALIHEVRKYTSARGEDTVGWEIIMGLMAAEIEASRQRQREREFGEEEC